MEDLDRNKTKLVSVTTEGRAKKVTDLKEEDTFTKSEMAIIRVTVYVIF